MKAVLITEVHLQMTVIHLIRVKDHRFASAAVHNGTHSEIIDHLKMRNYKSNKAPEAASKVNSSFKKTGAEYKS